MSTNTGLENGLGEYPTKKSFHHLVNSQYTNSLTAKRTLPRKSNFTHGCLFKTRDLLLVALTLFFLLPTQIFAAVPVSLQWDLCATPPDGYRLFQREAGQNYDYTQWVYEGEEAAHTVNNLNEGVTYHFVVRAYIGNVESEDSNEIRFEAPQPQGHTVNAAAGSGGSISPSGYVSVVDGQSSTYTFSANSGYQINDVLVDGVSQGSITSYTFSKVTANHTITVSFSAVAPQTHTITATSGIGGTISPSGVVNIEYGQNRSYTVSPSSGYQISDVQVDGSSQGALTDYTFSNVTTNHTIEARFSPTSSDQPPLAEAGPSQYVTSGSRVILNGSGCSDPEGGTLSYRWIQTAGPEVNLSDPGLVDPEFTAPEFSEGSIQLRFELTITNEKSLTASDTCLVQVTATQTDPIDTDRDGIPDNQDSDDDNDGMPDEWEIRYGLNPLDSEDATQDSDNDGMSNLNEYQQGTDPLTANDNQPPAQPTLTSPKDGDNRVRLSPTLFSSNFKDPDENDTHSMSQWLIQTADEQQVVFDILSNHRQLAKIKVPPNLLAPSTRYIARVRHYDNHELASEWSPAVAFTTEVDKNDKNKNRLPDIQEITAATVTDLNTDNITDSDQTEKLLRLKTYNDDNTIGLSIELMDTAVSIEAAASIDPHDLDGIVHSSEEMPYGMISYKIKVSEPGQSVRVQIFFSDPIDSQTPWVRYDSVSGWVDCTDQVKVDASGYRAEREIVDGGKGDADGIANGTVIDIAGPHAFSEGDSLSLSDGAGASSTQNSSCFIQSMY